MNIETKDKLIALGFKRVDMPLSVGSYEAMDESFNFNDSDVNLDPDLMYVKFILCHEGTNSNGDHFTKDVLHSAQYTPRMKPIDWEHGQPIIGTMLDSMYREDASGVGYIEAVGVVWKFIYPELSADIKKKSATGELKLSMECYYREANYKVGDVLYTHEEAEKLGIIQYVGREYMGNKVVRVFNEVIFGGVGVVATPADKGAVFLSVAKDLSKMGIDVNSNLEDSTAVAEAINRKVNDFTNKMPNSDVVDAVAVAKYVKAFDSAKSAIVDRFNKDSIKTKGQMLQEVRSVIDKFLSELASINDSYYKGTASSSGDEGKTLEELQLEIAFSLDSHYGNIDDSNTEAYLIGVKEDYFMYELIDHSQSSVDRKKLLKGFFNIVDGEVEINFDKAIEVKDVHQENAEQNINESEEDLVLKVDETKELEQTQATENKEEEVVVASQDCCGKEGCDCNFDYKAKATTLEATVEELKTKLSESEASKASLEEKITELQTKLDEIESEKVAQARKVELEGLGIVLSEARQAKLKGMSEDEYSDFKELLMEVAGSKVVETSQEEVVEDLETAEAEEVVEEEITVETEKSNAGLNIESTIDKEVKPFGHLA